MALSAQAALLDELMGKNRNAAPGDRVKNCHFSDGEVCKHFLCGFCPHELFVNTRADLGPCEKIHDENLRKQYEQSSRKGKMGYEEAFEVLLRGLLSDVEKRIKKGRDRLSLTQGSDDKLSSVRHERIHALNQQIDLLIAEADLLGREGNVEIAKETLERCEKLKVERLDLETRCINENAKAMEVCNVCGSFLIVGDAQCRVEEHITGKQHVGFAKIRSTVEQMKAERDKIVEERRKAREESMKTHEDERKNTRSDRNLDALNPSSKSPPPSRNSSRYHGNIQQRFHRSGDSFNSQHGYSSRHGRYYQGRSHGNYRDTDMDNMARNASPGYSPSHHDRNGHNWGSHNRRDQRSIRYRSGDWGAREEYSSGREKRHRRDDGAGHPPSNLPDSFDSWDELVANAAASDTERQGGDGSIRKQDNQSPRATSPNDPTDIGVCSQATRNALLNLAGCVGHKVVSGQNEEGNYVENKSGNEEFHGSTKHRSVTHESERLSRKSGVIDDSGFNQTDKRAKKGRTHMRSSHSSQDTSSSNDESVRRNGKSGRQNARSSRKVEADGVNLNACKSESSSNEGSDHPLRRSRAPSNTARQSQKRTHKSTSCSSSASRASIRRRSSSSSEGQRGHRTRRGRRHNRRNHSGDSRKGESPKRAKKGSPRRTHRRSRRSFTSTSASSS